MAAETAVIIGAGIAGCSTAYALAQRGIKVTLLERNAEIADGASGNPLAMLYPRLSGNDISSEFALAAYRHSLQLYRSLDLPPADFDCCGMLQLGFNAKELTRIKRVAAQGHAAALLHYVDANEASTLAGISIDHDALHFPDAAWINPKRLCRQLTQHQNIQALTHKHVKKILKTNALFEVHIRDDTVLAADMVVIANANDARTLCPDLPVITQAVRGQVSVVDAAASSRALGKILCSDGYLSPAALTDDSRLMHCLGATFSNIEADEGVQTDLAVSAEDHQANLQKLTHISSGLHNALETGIVSGRVSLRCTANDYWPMAGQLLDATAIKTHPPRPGADVKSLPWINGLFMNIAHGSKGFTTAPLCAEMIACMAKHEPLPVSNEIAGFLNPNRFLLKALGLKRLAKTV